MYENKWLNCKLDIFRYIINKYGWIRIIKLLNIRYLIIKIYIININKEYKKFINKKKNLLR